MATLHVSYLVSLSTLSVLVVVFNVFVCCLVCMNKALRTYTNGFVVSLALSDILTGGVLFPMILSKPSSLATAYLTSIIVFSSSCNLSSVTCARYVAIMKPLRSRYLVPKMFKKAVVFSWLIPIIFSLLPLFWNTNYELQIHKVYIICAQVFGFVVPCVFITFAYVRMFKEVRRSLALQKNFQVESPQERTNERRRLSKEIKIAKVFCIISAIFLFCWLPVIYMTTAQRVFSRSDIIPDFMPTVSLFTMAINSLVNPVIYAFLKPDFIIPIRIFMRSLFRGQCCRKQNLVGIEMNTFNPLTLSFRINLKTPPSSYPSISNNCAIPHFAVVMRK